MQERPNSSAFTMELRLFCTNPTNMMYCMQQNNDWANILIRVETHKKRPIYLTLLGQVWGVGYEDLGGNWLCYKSIALYLEIDNSK